MVDPKIVSEWISKADDAQRAFQSASRIRSLIKEKVNT